MKAALLALALTLTGDAPWQDETQTFAGIVCPTITSAERVANTGVSYALLSTAERASCIFMAFGGQKVGETADFNIGDHIYSFWTIEVEGGTVYLLVDKGEGYIA